jgi:hypothetical protein
LLASSGGGGHGFGGADEVVCRLEVEEVEVLEVVVFGRFEDVEWDAENFACFFVDGVEKVEEDLGKLVHETCLCHTCVVDSPAATCTQCPSPVSSMIVVS